MGKLDGKTAIVTGSSRGVGADVAKFLAAEGAAVVVNYRQGKQMLALVENNSPLELWLLPFPPLLPGPKPVHFGRPEPGPAVLAGTRASFPLITQKALLFQLSFPARRR